MFQKVFHFFNYLTDLSKKFLLLKQQFTLYSITSRAVRGLAGIGDSRLGSGRLLSAPTNPLIVAIEAGGKGENEGERENKI